MIFDIAVPKDGLGDIVLVEFGEEFTPRFSEGVDEDIEATAVGHSDNYFLDSGRRAGLEKRVENSDEGFASFEGEAFLADIAGVEKSFEGFGGNNFFEDAALLGGGEGGLVAVAFHAIAEPTADAEVHDVHEFDADVVAVGLFEEGENIAQGAWTAAAEGAGIKNGIEIGVGKAEGGKG